MILQKKYIIIALLGIILMIVGRGTETEKKTQESEFFSETPVFYDTKRLERVLESVAGAGNVQVFISYENDGRKEIAQQIERTESAVVNMPEEVNDTYYVLSNRRPEIAGVLVTATGAEDSKVRNRLLNAVKHALGVPYYKITVEVAK